MGENVFQAGQTEQGVWPGHSFLALSLTKYSTERETCSSRLWLGEHEQQLEIAHSRPCRGNPAAVYLTELVIYRETFRAPWQAEMLLSFFVFSRVWDCVALVHFLLQGTSLYVEGRQCLQVR